MRPAREHPRITAAIAVLLALLVLAGLTAGGTLAGASSPERVSGRIAKVTNAESAALRVRLDTTQTQNAYLRGEVSALQARLASARPAISPAKAANGRSRKHLQRRSSRGY